MEVLESYENEMTVNVGQVTNNRVKQLEEITEGYRQQVASLEEDAEYKSRVLQESNARCRQLESQLRSKGGLQTVPVSSQVDQDLILSLR